LLLLLRILPLLLRGYSLLIDRGLLNWGIGGALELLGLLVCEDDLGLDDGHALGREAVQLLLETHDLVTGALRRHLEPLGLRAAL
jgi:hypothetical protein